MPSMDNGGDRNPILWPVPLTPYAPPVSSGQFTTGSVVPSRDDRSITIKLAAMNRTQRNKVQLSLNRRVTTSDVWSPFEIQIIESRGMKMVKEAEGADVVVMGLEDGELPGEADHLLSAYPSLKVIGVDKWGRACIVRGAADESLSSDLATVVWWVTRRRQAAGPSELN